MIIWNATSKKKQKKICYLKFRYLKNILKESWNEDVANPALTSSVKIKKAKASKASASEELVEAKAWPKKEEDVIFEKFLAKKEIFLRQLDFYLAAVKHSAHKRINTKPVFSKICLFIYLKKSITCTSIS